MRWLTIVLVASSSLIACDVDEMQGVAKMAACLESSSRTTCVQRQLIESSDTTRLSAGQRVGVRGTPYQIELASDGWLQIASGAEKGLYLVHESGEAHLVVAREEGQSATARQLAFAPMQPIAAKLESEPDEIATASGFFGDDEAVLLSMCFRTRSGSSYPERTECWATAGVTRTRPAISIFAVGDQESAAFPLLGELINGFGVGEPIADRDAPAPDRP